MTLLSPADLQSARKAAAERFLAIGLAHVPEGYTIKYRRSLSGVCYGGQTKRIEAPRPVTRRALYIFLHECAHAHLHGDCDKPSHIIEHEAEVWAHEKMRAAGVAVPRSSTRHAKSYVARKIRQDIRRGVNIDPAARHFAAKT